MKQKEFGIKCKELNGQYKAIFDTIPNPDDYLLSREDYILALTKAIKEKKEISNFAKKRILPSDPNALY